MRNRIITLLCLFAFTLPVFAAAGTEGREFWVALTLCGGPDNDVRYPYIAVSSKHIGTNVSVIDRYGATICTKRIPASGWVEFSSNATANCDIPLNKWYPTQNGITPAQQTNMFYGLKVVADNDVSVFAACRIEYSFDASNILPVTALQKEYIIQDYPAYNHDGEGHPVFTVLATQNNTQVSITPSAQTSAGSPANQPINIVLQEGQVYYVAGTNRGSLSGSRVVANNPIAVFNGCDITDVPGPVSARDLLYEQAMPVDYWGREFIVTRSMQRDANRIRVTAQENETTIAVDGQIITTIQSGETFEFELSSEAFRASKAYQKANEAGRGCAYYFTGYAHYVQTSCPCAVYSYDVSDKYELDNNSEEPNISQYGDPSMVWVAPLEQKIQQITFGALGTNYTTEHFVNIVTLTQDTASIHLYQANGRDIIRKQDWQVVPGNPMYSYLRQNLCVTDGSNNGNNPTFTLVGNGGFIAHVYGNGIKESYAYSCGSAAVKRGLQLDNEILLDQDVSTHTYCLGQEIEFNTQVGSDIIDSVIWDLGDGTKLRGSNPVIKHTYEAMGWYNLSIVVFAHKECPETTYPAEYVNVRFYVGQADTIRKDVFICEGETFVYEGVTYTESTLDTLLYECDSVVILNVEVGKKSYTELFQEAHDSLQWHGTWYYESGDLEWHGINMVGCDSTVVLHLHVLTCLEMETPDTLPDLCGDDTFAAIPYTYYKGDIGDASLYITDGSGGITQQLPLTIDTDNQLLIFDCSTLKAGIYHAIVTVEDTVCKVLYQKPLAFTIRYPNSIFEQKWNDVLAVLNSQYNGGYVFTAFQWYRNGEPIAGAINSVYSSPEPLSADDEYYVQLTTSNGVTLPSCAKSGQSVTIAPAPSVEVQTRIGLYMLHILLNDGVVQKQIMIDR